MSETKVICVDFDGVVHDFQSPVPGRRMGGPIFQAAEALTMLQQHGYRIVILSVRGDDSSRQYLTDWFEFYHIPFDEITNVKPNADFYIDDKGLRFTTWPEALKEILYPETNETL